VDGSIQELASGDFVTSNFAVGGGRIAVVGNEGSAPGEVYAVEEGRVRQLTRDGSRWFGPFRRELVNVRFGKRSGGDFVGWLIPGRGQGKKRPLVLTIHGGPYLAYGPPPTTTMLAIADAGFHVLYTNPRGSMGYGEEYSKALHGAWGEPDTGDQLRALQWAVREGYADRDRIGVIGGSYGGYMTAWLLGHHPGRFAAAVCENPVSDLVAEFGHSDFGFFSIEGAAGVRLPHDDPERVREKSPSAHIHRNRTPLLLIQAENDMRCPPSQSEILFAALRWLERPVELVRYPGESHALGGTGRPDRRQDRLERIIAWFEQHL
jgi:dipeptidyl aminopeptidase/acylaminoacyl peptidase